MIKLQNVTIKNFLSVGNVTQAIDLCDTGLTLILGDNLDLGSGGSRNGVGKAQPLYSKVMTPTGYKTIGDIEEGDIVSTPFGKTAKVSGVFPQGITDNYKITFEDGRIAESSSDHIWRVWHRPPGRTDSYYYNLPLSDIKPFIDKNYRISIPCEATYHDEKELPIDPYIFGALLANGYLHDIYFNMYFEDDEERLMFEEKLPIEYEMKNRDNVWMIDIKDQVNELKEYIKSKNLNVTLDKFYIPDEYKYSSIEQRTELLKGYIDNCGETLGYGFRIKTLSDQLAKDLQNLIWSLGGKSSIKSKKNKTFAKRGINLEIPDKSAQTHALQVDFRNGYDYTNISRKKPKSKHKGHHAKEPERLRIISIEKMEDTETKCIMLDDKDHLYFTDNYIITHNTTIIQAISFALYGQAITNIKKDNLINNINTKNMVVSLEFTKGMKKYRIERGRKPTFLKFYVDDGLVNPDDNNEAKGESKDTQEEIENIIGLSHSLFKHIITLHTKTTPFLDLTAKDQRNIIEELFGITLLSKKAEILKNDIKDTKDYIREEEIQIKINIDNNEKTKKAVNDLEFKSKLWKTKYDQNISELISSVNLLKNIDIEQEIDQQKKLEDKNKLKQEISSYEKQVGALERSYNNMIKLLEKVENDISKTNENKCHTCGQNVHDEQLFKMKEQQKKDKDDLEEEISNIKSDINILVDKLTELYSSLPNNDIKTIYANLEEALNHRHMIELLENDIVKEQDKENPYIDQIENLLTTSFKDIEYDKLHEFTKLKDHQEFLLKILTDKNSFVRKKIIDQNLTFLNNRLNYYLEKMGLPHEVTFMSDLSVNISKMGRDYDFAQFSNGEQNRLVLSLAWSFRDVWEQMNESINLMIIDELIDSGMDSTGTDAGLSILKTMTRERNKNVFLISHKDGLESRVDKILKVIMEDSFTSYNNNI